MPIFEFTCKSCKDDFELLVGSVARSEDKKCPNCGSADINKRFSVFGFKSSGNG
ncbi:MAG: zinc ribbon domain-containing protein, partial [Terriglobia bacterium]